MRWFVDLHAIGRRLSSSDRRSISPAIRYKLVQSVFDQRSSIMVGAASTVLFGVICRAQSGQRFFIAWTLLSLLVFAGRLILARAYAVSSTMEDTQIWADRFVIGAALTGLVWGIGSSFSILNCDPFLQMMMITGQATYLSIACIRNTAIPKSAIAQSTLPIFMASFACFLRRDVYYTIYGMLCYTQLIAILQITSFLYKQTLDLLTAEERAASTAAQLADANERLMNLAKTDGLTGVVNRRGFDESLAAACDRAMREASDLSILLLDIDLFKLLNDRIGHQAGDDCLRRLGVLFKASVRGGADIVARYGGEEFAIILPNTGADSAARIAEALRAGVESLAVLNPGSPLGIVTISIGCASLLRDIVVDPGTLIKAADDALYAAKARGRNRVESLPSVITDPSRAPGAIAA